MSTPIIILFYLYLIISSNAINTNDKNLAILWLLVMILFVSILIKKVVYAIFILE